MGGGVSSSKAQTPKKKVTIVEPPRPPPESMYEAESKTSFNAAEMAERSRLIDEQLMAEKHKEKRVLKILLLGGPESGKSTIFKQMRILFTGGFSESDMTNFRLLIYANTLQAINQLVDGCRLLKIDMDRKRYADIQRLEEFNKLTRRSDSWGLSEEFGAILTRLWTSTSIKECYAQRDKITLLDSAAYFLDSVERIASKDYHPTAQDVIRTRIATTGIHEIEFTFKQASIRMVDVGGQKSEQRKWIHCFDNVHGVLFVAALSEYMRLYDEENPNKKPMNRLLYSLELFETLTTNPNFGVKTAMIVFLNKVDIFKVQLSSYPLSSCFPTFKGQSTFEEASLFVERQFLKRARKPVGIQPVASSSAQPVTIQVKKLTQPTNDRASISSNSTVATETVAVAGAAAVASSSRANNTKAVAPHTFKRQVYVHFTNATDTDNVDRVFDSCMDVVFKNSMAKVGFM